MYNILKFVNGWHSNTYEFDSVFDVNEFFKKHPGGIRTKYRLCVWVD